MRADLESWGTAAWIGRPATEVIEVDPTPDTETRPDLTMAMRPPALLRTTFTANSPRARLRITARGIYRAWVNGQRVSDEWLAPGWTDYAVRLHVQEFDVGHLLVSGENSLAIEVADGWYSGYVGFDRGHQARLYGTIPVALAQIRTHAGDVLTETGAHWRRATGAIVYADLQMGEMHSPALEPVGWREVGFDDSGWMAVGATPLDATDPLLHASAAPPIRCTQRVRPVAVETLADGRRVVDFGQNLVGVVRLRVRGQRPGTRIHIRHAEVLDASGEPYFTNLRTALALDIFESAGGDEVFEPQYTFHGFRYAVVEGLDGPLDDIEALVLHTDVRRVGWLETGDERINRLHENIDWSVRGNLLDVPTDCPQRDERLGWLGDAGLIMTTASWLRDLDGLLEKWTSDIRDAQSPEGAYPDVAPMANLRVGGAPGWADAGAIIPWIAHLHFESTDRLAANYPAMQRWMDFLVSHNPDLVRVNALGRNYGDWLNLADATPKSLLATAYFAYDAEVLAHAASALGRTDDADGYVDLRSRIVAAFQREYVDADGRLAGDTQTGYAMALHLDLLTADQRTRGARRLAELVEHAGHLTTGIHGTRFLCPALSDIGRDDLAYDLLLRDEFPGWIHQIDSGATSIWERWDGYTAERGFQTPRMNSFNHYALGSIGEWLHRYAAGVTPVADRPAYRHTVVRPHPSSRLGFVKARRATADGELSAGWAVDGDSLRVEVTVPATRTATIHVPTMAGGGGWEAHEVGAGIHSFVAPFDDSWVAPPTLSPDRHV